MPSSFCVFSVDDEPSSFAISSAFWQLIFCKDIRDPLLQIGGMISLHGLKGKVCMLSMDQFFDKIYVVTLESSKDRIESMESQFKRLGIKNYIMFPAAAEDERRARGSREELIKEQMWAFPGNKFHCTMECSCHGAGHVLSDGQIASSVSHARVYEDIAAKGYSRCLVLEDDCVFLEAVQKFDEIIKDLPDDWDLLYLGQPELITDWNSTEIGSDYLKRLVHGVALSHIYGITGDAAKIMAKDIFPIRAASDGYLAHFVVTKRLLERAFISKISLALNGSLTGHFQTFLGPY